MKWKAIIFLQLFLCAVLPAHAQQKKVITIEDILKQQKENLQLKNVFLRHSFKPELKNNNRLKTTALSKMPLFAPPIALVNAMPVLWFKQPKNNKIPNGYRGG